MVRRPQIEHLGDHPANTAVGLYILECGEFAEIVPAIRELPGDHCVVFLVANFRTTTVDELTALSSKMIEAGARYLSASGEGCRTAHLAFDLACCEFETDRESVIITTDHSYESLPDAIWFVVNCAYPVDPYDQGWHATIAICVNDEEASRLIRHAFTDGSRMT